MTDFNPDEYFNSKFDATLSNKMQDLADASAFKIEALKQYRSVADANMVAQEQAKEKNKNSWVGKLGLEEGSFTANRVNDVASLVSGTGRLAGHIASLPVNMYGGEMTSDATSEDYAAYNRYTQNKATPEDLIRLEGTFSEKSAISKLARFQEAEKSRQAARGVNEFFDVTKIVNQSNREVLGDGIGQSFKENWGKITGGWDEATRNDFLKGSGEMVSGMANLLYSTGKAVIENPSGVREYVIENAPQLLIGVLGKAGQVSMAASNIGYAADYYQQGVEAYQAKNNGQLPPDEDRQRMATMAATLALAEQLGDKAGLAAMKTVGATGAGGIKGIAQAGAQGLIGESLTEGYQTYAEGEVIGKPVTAEEIYTGAVIGGLSGGILSGGVRTAAEVSGATPEQQQLREEVQTKREQFNEAVTKNDPSIYLDETKKDIYDPSLAIGVLLQATKREDATPELKEENFTKAGEIVNQLESKKEELLDRQFYTESESIKQQQDRIVEIQAKIDALPDTATDELNSLTELKSLAEEELATNKDKKNKQSIEVELSKLDMQLKTATTRLSGFNLTVDGVIKPEEVDALVSEIDTIREVTPESTAKVSRVINLAMRSPEMVTPEAATALAENKSNPLSEPQREQLRKFSAARIAENNLMKIDDVTEELLNGKKGAKGKPDSLGMNQYREKIATALRASNKPTAERYMSMLDTLVTSHRQKADLVAEAITEKFGIQIIKTKEGGWKRNTGERLTDAEMKINGGVTVNSPDLVEKINREALLLEATQEEMKFAVATKFGVDSQSSQEIPATPSKTLSSQEMLEGETRPVLPKGNTEPTTPVSEVSSTPVKPVTTPVVNPYAELPGFTSEAMAAQYIQQNKVDTTKFQITTDTKGNIGIVPKATVKPKTEVVATPIANEFTPTVEEQAEFKNLPAPAIPDASKASVVNTATKMVQKIGKLVSGTGDPVTAVTKLLTTYANTKPEEAKLVAAEVISDPIRYGFTGNVSPAKLVSLVSSILTPPAKTAAAEQQGAVSEANTPPVAEAATSEAVEINTTPTVLPSSEPASLIAAKAAQATAPSSATTEMKKDLKQAQKAFNKTKKSNPVSLWNTVKGQLNDSDLNDTFGNEWKKRYTMLKGKSARTLSSMVADGMLDEFLPYDMRFSNGNPNPGMEQDAVEYVKEALRTKNFMTYETNQELNQISSTIQQLEAALKEVTLEELENELRIAENEEQRESDVETSETQTEEQDRGTEVSDRAEEATGEAANTTVSSLGLFAQKTTNGVEKAFKLKNLIADYFKQAIGSDTGTKRPLANMSDFLTQLETNRYATVEQFIGREINEKEDVLLSKFIKLAREWQPKIEAHLTRQENKEFNYRDMMQFMVSPEGEITTEENVKTAISYAAFDAILNLFASGIYNDDASINGILGRSQNSEVSKEARKLLGNVGTLLNVARNSWGEVAVKSLGLKALNSAPKDLQPRLEAAMGAHVYLLLLDLGVVEQSNVSNTEFNAILNEGKNTTQTSTEIRDSILKARNVLTLEETNMITNLQKLEEKAANGKVLFVKMVRDAENEVTPLAKDVFETNKGTQSFLSKLFSVESFYREPTLSPVKYVQKKAGDWVMDIPNTLRKIMRKANESENFLNQDMFKHVFSKVTEETMLEIAGQEDEAGKHAANKLGIKAKNDGLKREYTNLKDFIEQTLLAVDISNPIHFEHDVWIQQRVGIKTNMVNPQSSKLQRQFFYKKSWESEIDFNNEESMDNFKLRVAEGLGVKVDKNDKDTALAEFNKIIALPEIKGAVNVLRKSLNTAGELSANDQAILVAGVKKGGEATHSLNVLLAMASYAEAKANKQTSFKTYIMAEVDGVTNGPMLSHLLFGAANTVKDLFTLLNKGGFYQIGSPHSQYNVWRAVGHHLDLYESTTRKVLDNVAILLKDGKINQDILQSVYAFTGELEDSKFKIQKAGRNIIKTPLTAIVFGSSESRAVESMAENLVDSVYESIENLFNNKEGALTREQILENLNTMGVSWPKDITVDQMMVREFTNREAKNIKESLKNTIGVAVKNIIRSDFGQFLEQRDQFNQTGQLTYDMYNTIYENERAKLVKELMESGAIETSEKTGLPLHDLSRDQEKVVEDRVKALYPILHTGMSKDSNQLSAGLSMIEPSRKLADNPVYINETRFGGNGPKTAVTRAYEQVLSGPGLRMAPMAIHSFDSMVSHYAAKLMEVLNIHDAHGAGVNTIKQAAKNLNQAVWIASLKYSPANEMHESFMRTARALSEMYKDGMPPDVAEAMAKTLIERSQEYKGSSPYGLFSLIGARSKSNAYKADAMKYEAMMLMTSIDQYAMEGGNYEVTMKDRAEAKALRDGLVEELSDADKKLLDNLDTQLQAAIKKQEDTIIRTKQGVNPNSNPALVAFFLKNPVVKVSKLIEVLSGITKNDFNVKLLKMLSKSIDKDMTVRYVTPKTNPKDVLEQGEQGAAGWYVSKGDKHEIYLDSNIYNDIGLTTELVLHELTHGALARTIEIAQQEGKGDAFKAVKDLDSLRVKAIKFIKEQNLGNQFDQATKNVHELVSWGMTNKAFQDQVLKVMLIPTKKNLLVRGMEAFIQSLVQLVFGRENVNMESGMANLITNSVALFKVAAESKAPITNVNVVANMTGVQDYTTMDVFNALGNRINNGVTNSPEFVNHLGTMMTDLVGKLFGPYGVLKASLMQSRQITAEQIYDEAVATGEAPFASKALNSGFYFTDQEAFALEQIEVTVRAGLESNAGVTTIAYRELAKLYEEAKATLKVEQFHKGDWATATQQEKDAAGKLYDFVFRVETSINNRSDYLSRFAALGLANEQFNKVLGGLTTNAQTRTATTFVERLLSIFEKIMNFFAGKMTSTFEGQQADEKLMALVTQLVKNEVRRKAMLTPKTTIFDPIEENIDKLSEKVRERIEKFGKLPFFKLNTNPFIRLAGSLTSTYAGNRFDVILQGLKTQIDRVKTEKPGVMMATLTEVQGANDTNLVFHFLLRITKRLESMRKEIITETGKAVLSGFNNNGQDMSMNQQKSLSSIGLRTDMSVLLDKYTVKDITRMLTNPVLLERAIADYEGQLASINQKYSRYFINMSRALGFFKVTGKSAVPMLLLNAHNIARMFGTNYTNKMQDTQAKLATPAIDILVSLYAIKYSPKADRDNFVSVAKIENSRTDGNGIEMMLKAHRELQRESKEKLFDQAEALQIKGYTPEILDPYIDIKIVEQSEVPDLLVKGYTVASVLSQDPANPEVKKVLLSRRDGGMKSWLSGIQSTTGMNSKGTEVHNGNLHSNTYAGKANRNQMASIYSEKSKAMMQVFQSKNFDPSNVLETHMVPVLNADGDVVNYRYMMQEDTKDILLRRDNRPDKILGMLAGNIFDKVNSKEQNAKGIQALKDQYDLEFAQKSEGYLEVGPKSADPELREIWRLMPQTTKDEIRSVWGSDSMMVRNDLLDINFGYRKLSIADGFEKDKDARNIASKIMIYFAEAAWGGEAALKIRKGEDIWQEIMKEAKANLVVRSLSTLLGNVRSNVSYLLLAGVSPMAIIRHHRVAIRGAFDYKRDSAKLFDMENQIKLDYYKGGKTKAQLEEEIIKLKDAMARNPIKPLIDAGLMPTIVEDVEADNDIHSYKSDFIKWTEKATDKINPSVLNVAKFLIMSKDSSAYQAMSYATQISDFVARYTLYQDKTTGKNPLSHTEAVQLVSDAFVNYDVPTHRKIQYMNDMGFMMFTKYYVRIQKMIFRMYKDHPARVMAMLGLEAFIGAQPTVLDSSMVTRFGNPFGLGILGAPGTIDEITTIKMLMSPFSSGGGNPTE